MRIIHLFAPFLLLGASANLMANDTPVGVNPVGAGGIEFTKSSAVSMEKEVLTISPDLVRVEYVFVNQSDKPVTEHILFPMPFYAFDTGCGFESETYSGDLQQFRVWVDGKELAPGSIARARLSDGSDVTARLRALGLNDHEIADFAITPADCGGSPPDKRLAGKMPALIKEGLFNDAGGPAWEASRAYYWDQVFPPHQKVRVTHEYAPFLGKPLDDGHWSKEYSPDDNRGHFCIDRGTYKAILNSAANGRVSMEVDYVLTTGANWSGPIRDFTLVLKKPSPLDTLSLCFPGSFKKRDAHTLVSHMTNFTPTSDLAILYLTADREMYPLPHYK